MEEKHLLNVNITNEEEQKKHVGEDLEFTIG